MKTIAIELEQFVIAAVSPKTSFSCDSKRHRRNKKILEYCQSEFSMSQQWGKANKHVDDHIRVSQTPGFSHLPFCRWINDDWCFLCPFGRCEEHY